jgi:tetratricopeptide (TPR) repeat protein
MDRLEDNLKRTMQVASVIGRDFALRILQAITGMKEELKSYLINLQGLEFIYEKRLFPELEYIFKHALIQEVAYNSLLQKRRKEIHENIGKAIEEIYSDRIEEFYEMLAFHYARTDLADKAIRYLSLAAEKASNAYAHEEAVAWLQEAIEHTDRFLDKDRDSCCIDLVIRLADSLFYLGRRNDSIECLLNHEDRLKRIQRPDLACKYYLYLSRNYSFQGERDRAFHHAQRSLEEAKKAEDEESMGRAYVLMAVETWFSGPLQQSATYGEHAVSILEHANKPRYLAMAYYALGFLSIDHGDFRRGKHAAECLHAISEAIGDPRRKAHSAYIFGLLETAMGQWDKGIDHYHRALDIAPDLYEKAIISGFLGYAYLEKNDNIKAVTILENAVEQANQYRSRQVQNWFMTFLGEAYDANGQTEKAQKFVSQGLYLAKNIMNPWGVGIAQRALGRIFLRLGNFVDAEIHLQEALSSFNRIQARPGEARTHLDLATLAHTQGNQSIAITHLNKAYSWFKKLQAPKFLEHCEELARGYGIAISELELDESRED